MTDSPSPTTGPFDFIIVGAGTAGCLLADRLSINPNHRVLLIEAGGRDNYHWIHIPVGYLYCIDNPRTDWRFRTEPVPGLNGRSLIYPRGKTLGGCSSINGMLYIRGQRRDYDHWAEVTGEDAWRWDNCLPDFMRHEDHYRMDEGGDADPDHHRFHGHGGEWRVEHQRLSWQVLEDFAAAAVQAGVPRTRDFNRGDNEGVDYFEVNQRSGWRWNTSKAFLRKAAKRPNLTVWHSTRVLGLVMDAGTTGGARCTGVRVARQGQSEVVVHASREVLLSAGAIGSPQLLQLSGIGPSELLEQHGIPVVQDLPGVGENLAEYRYANIQYHVQPLSLDAFGQPLHDFPAITASVCNLNPTSRGTVRIRSANPEDAPAIAPNYLSTAEDRKVAADSLRVTRRIAGQPAFACYQPEEYKPGVQFQSDDELARLAGDIGTTIFHPVGTTRMGRADDPMAVVDPHLRVRGVSGLRVVDAGVMPTITSGNTNSPTLMIAEKAAAWILAGE
ncbi:FAD-binding protein [Marinobacter lipolyticus]|uniref:GMC family oxidoreductase n=1 Tax=Marinobacter lipolyticus TaxID=209639 RepID=UPI001BD1959C|nr:GMC family oxidoreductase N-terminal domain-containing protein [Marinobacter lipolyticus]MBS8240938.1 FAD-binding protein [Marinobacter lipolyticus]